MFNYIKTESNLGLTYQVIQIKVIAQLLAQTSHSAEVSGRILANYIRYKMLAKQNYEPED
jgi:hypothetical protein